MKQSNKGFITLLLTLSFFIQTKAQDNSGKYGKDSLGCLGNLSTMNEYVKIKVYEYAYNPWKQVFKDCPGSSKNIYIQGKKILEYQIENAKDEQTKEAYIDTLMLMYDMRIKYFGEESKVLGKKGVDLLQFRRSAVEEAYGILSKALEIGGNETEASALVTLVSSSSVLYSAGKIEADEMITTYIKSIEALDSQRSSPRTVKAKENIEKVFAESGAADCDALVEIFTPKYEANKEDVETLKKIIDLLKQTKCQESELFTSASESLYQIEPSSEAGANLALVFSTRGEYDRASEYYLKAIEQETDNDKKADYYYSLAAIALKQKEYPKVKTYGTEAVKLNPDFGKAYILIGNAYAAGSSSCGSSNFSKAAAFLAAVDKFTKAKSVDPGVQEEATELINRYSQYFPNNEDAFFEGYTDGQSYNVGCWINETTTIRTTKNK